MRVALRETGSILVQAPREQVMDLLRTKMATEPGRVSVMETRVRADRPGDRVLTFILRDAPGGTQVIHARSERAPLGLSSKPRDDLRLAVQAELFEVRHLAEASRRQA